MTDYTETERVVRVQVEVPLYGSDVHVNGLRERLQRMLELNFEGVKITHIDNEETPVT